MAVASGISVANIYYAQPLLEQFAQQFHTTVAGVAAVPSATQIGYAAGLMFLVQCSVLNGTYINPAFSNAQCVQTGEVK